MSGVSLAGHYVADGISVSRYGRASCVSGGGLLLVPDAVNRPEAVAQKL
jgi:hypothetical protein